MWRLVWRFFLFLPCRMSPSLIEPAGAVWRLCQPMFTLATCWCCSRVPVRSGLSETPWSSSPTGHVPPPRMLFRSSTLPAAWRTGEERKRLMKQGVSAFQQKGCVQRDDSCKQQFLTGFELFFFFPYKWDNVRWRKLSMRVVFTFWLLTKTFSVKLPWVLRVPFPYFPSLLLFDFLSAWVWG